MKLSGGERPWGAKRPEKKRNVQGAKRRRGETSYYLIQMLWSTTLQKISTVTGGPWTQAESSQIK